MLPQNLKTNLKKLISDFRESNAWTNSEEHIQTLYTSKVLELLGYATSNIRINQGQDVKTGKKPDILLLNNLNNTILVIESKEASKKDVLDGKYQTKTFIEQLHEYCKAEGIHWGILTNFVEWRVYSIYQNRLYKEKKYAFHELLWQGAKAEDYINLLSDEGMDFFKRLSKNNLVQCKGKWDSDPVYYPKQEEIKEKFFQDLKKWRQIIRNDLSKNYNQKHSLESIDLMTQKILDRLIFIDYCADNQILTQDRLHAILYTKDNLYKELEKIFSDMDEKFNSELFAKTDVDHIEIKDEIIRPIIIELSNIDFNRLSVHIIGEVYENYLAEILKKSRQNIQVEETKASQKKKTQGIYYTPDYIVDYIVSNTVGAILKKCKTVEEIEKIKVLDPACGSGSFLIRVFDEFLKYYERIDPKGIFQFETRKKILQNNIYGVDLDERAVEIAKLNLMIKALENCQSVSLTGRKLLPNLKLNIRCGNSLISGETSLDEMKLFRKDSERDMLELKKLHKQFHNTNDSKERDTLTHDLTVLEYSTNTILNAQIKSSFQKADEIKPFNYSIAFPEILESGGFDCVIGNPPYTQLSLQTNTSQRLKDYLLSTYKSSMGRLNTFGFFISKGLMLLKNKGLFGYIIPNTILTQDYYKELRKIVLDQSLIKSIVTFENLTFKDAVVENIILHLEKKESGQKEKNSVGIFKLDQDRNLDKINSLPQNQFYQDRNFSFHISINENKLNLQTKIQNVSKELSEFVFINQGIALKQDRAKYLSKTKVNPKYKPVLDGRNINRYSIEWDKMYLAYDVNAIHSGKNEDIYLTKEKLFFRRVSSTLIAALDKNQFYALNTLVVMNRKPNMNYDIRYILALFNSKLLNWYYTHFLKSTKKVFSEIQARQVAKLPIKTINLSDKKDQELYHKIIAKVDEIVKLSNSPNSREKYTIQIQSIDREIDNLVFDLYGVMREELG